MLLRKATFPNRVDGIPIERACSRLHFLHAAVFDAGAGIEVGRYVLHSAEGVPQTIPIRYGDDVRNWQMATEALKAPSSAQVVWSSTNQMGTIRLFKSTWENPKPEVPVHALDFVSSMTQCAPFLLAITVEE